MNMAQREHCGKLQTKNAATITPLMTHLAPEGELWRTMEEGRH